MRKRRNGARAGGVGVRLGGLLLNPKVMHTDVVYTARVSPHRL